VVANAALVQAVKASLGAAANPAQAAPMQAYMKSAMPFVGVAAPQRRQVVAACAKAHPCSDAQTLADTVLALWRIARHREHRYAALDLLRQAPHRKLIDTQLLPVLHELLQTDPWWDFNDEISGQVLPLLLARDPATMKPLLRRWARGDDLWLRRAAMLAQRALKSGFDAVLLYDCILPSLLGPGAHPVASDFFIRKGMGWALRERSYAAPEEVQAFVAEYRSRLSPLTQREALKVIHKRAVLAPSG
jgi:3-methyladenine DNA glycosylase AlkD